MEFNANPATFIYVHGAGNKPPESDLKSAWDEDLFGQDMKERTRMVYYADLLHDRPAAIAADACSASGALGALVSDAFADTALIEDAEVREAFAEMAPVGQEFALSLAISMAARAASPTGLAPTAGARPAAGVAELLPLPGPLRRFLLRQLLRHLIPDANGYFFTGVQERIRDRLRTVLNAVNGPVVVVSHSLGTVVAYDVLSEAGLAQKQVPLFITLGSPLGYTEIQDVIARPLRIPAPVRLWTNFADPLDLVTLDTTLADDFRTGAKVIADIVVDNPSPNNHASCGYLRSRHVREAAAAAK
ncbi:hypothetical protein [Streptomyces sp. NBC_00620]|uniref:hypothetical protein n=1 Tax=Streptomyces sp. NBC_00620 TaxID=2903666 RepID=UPI00224EEFE6|nr:hypothetical protein [Streptomyces sp. NBC_00620]MCX4974716.1 hypothetical protein [Streptomyces sp. NBC_00620]